MNTRKGLSSDAYKIPMIIFVKLKVDKRLGGFKRKM